MLGQLVPDPEKWGILQLNKNGNLRKLVEKPLSDIGNLANTGAYMTTSEIFTLYSQINPSPRGEYEITDTISLLAQQHPVHAIQTKDYWLPVGYPWHILEANKILTKKFYPSAGQKVIGQNVTIGRNVSLNGNVVIGHNVTIGDNVHIDSSTIFDHTIIHKSAVIAHSVIGRNTSIGCRVIVQSKSNHSPTVITNLKGNPIDTGRPQLGAIIGDNAIIGEDTTITAGIKIGPNITIEANQSIERDCVD